MRLVSASGVWRSFVPPITNTGLASDFTASIGRSWSGSTPVRSGICATISGASQAPGGPRYIDMRLAVASSMVGYITSITSASMLRPGWDNTAEAAPSDTPITPIRSPGRLRLR